MDANGTISTTVFQDVDVALIDPNPHQPRALTTSDEIRELAEDIKVRGLLNPIVVTPSSEKGRYVLVAGSRRLTAVKLNCMKKVPCSIRPSMTDAELLENALIENIQRESLTDWEEAVAIQELMEFRGLGVRQVAKLISKSPAYVSKRLRVFGNPALNEAVRSGRISTSTAEELLSARCDSETLRSYAQEGVTRQQLRGGSREYACDRSSPVSGAMWEVLGGTSMGDQVATGQVRMILREQGLGEIVARVRDYATALKTLLVDRHDYMDEKCWAILSQAKADIEQCLADHESSKAEVRCQPRRLAIAAGSTSNRRYIPANYNSRALGSRICN